MPDTGDDIASAYVAIYPDLDEFEEQLRAGVDEAVESVDADVGIGADLEPAQADVDAWLAELSEQQSALDVDADVAPADATVDAWVAEVDATTATIEVDADLAPAETELAASDLLGAAGTGPADLGPAADEAAAGLEDLAAAAADADSAVVDLDTATTAIGATFDAAAAGSSEAATQIATLATAADMAGLSFSDLASALEAGGIQFSDVEAAADAAGVSVVSYMTGLAGAASEFENVGLLSFDEDITALEAQGSALASFFQSATAGMLDWDQYMPVAAQAAAALGLSIGDVGASLGTVSAQLQDFRTALTEANSVLLEAGTAAQQAATQSQALEAGQSGVASGLAATAAAAFDAGTAFDDFEVSADLADAALAKILDTVATDEVAGAGMDNWVLNATDSFSGWANETSTLIEVLMALAPVLVGTVSAALGGMLALAGSAVIGLSGIGVGVLAIIPDLSALESAVKDAYDGWQAMTDAAGLAMPAVQALGSIVSEVLGDISPLVQPAISAFEQVESVINEMAQSPALHSFVSWLGTALGPTAQAFTQSIGEFVQGLGTMLEESWPFIEQIENGMISLGADFDKFATSNGFKDFISWLQQNAPAVGQIIANIVGIIGELWEGFMALATVFDPIVEGFTKFVDVLLELKPLDVIIAGIVTAVGALALLVTPILAVGAAIGALSGIGLAAGVGVASGLALITGGIAAVGVAAAVGGYEIAAHFGGIETAGEDVGDWFANSFPHFFEAGYDDVANSAEAFGSQLASGWDQVTSGASAVGSWFANSLPNFFESGFHTIYTWATGIFDDVLSFFESLPAKMAEVGEDIIEGFWHGLEAAWDSVFGWLTDAANDVINIFKKVLSIFSPSGAMFDVGSQTMEGFGLGLQAGWVDHVSGVLASQAASVLGAFANVTAPIVGSATITSPTLPSSAGLTPSGGDIHVTSYLTVQSTNEGQIGAMKQLLDQRDRKLAATMQARSRGH